MGEGKAASCRLESGKRGRRSLASTKKRPIPTDNIFTGRSDEVRKHEKRLVILDRLPRSNWSATIFCAS
jgi:hypothetical protein